jgi:hypothetical protein
MRYPKILLLIFAGVCMVGQGSRMIVEGILANKVYRPGTFDILFDWTTLAVIGLILFIWGTYLFYKELKKRAHVYWDLECPNCGAVHTDDVKKKDVECPVCHYHSDVDLKGFNTRPSVEAVVIPG